MKKIGLTIIACLFLILMGCNTEKSEKNSIDELIPIAVDVKISPEVVKPNEEVAISATVTQGDEKVDDADEVRFEIWEKGKEDENEFVEVVNQKNGVYSITKTFDHDGIYYVTAHVTARSMHSMPKVELVVGDVTISEDEGEDAVTEEHSHSHDHHGNGQVSIIFEPESEYKKDKETTLLAKLEEAGAPLAEARVRYEIWKDGSEKHEFIDAIEDNAGAYETKFVFAEVGTYHLQVHVEKGEIHEHIEKTVIVK